MNTDFGNQHCRRIAADELNRISQRVIGCAYQISNILGCGFLEKVYENAMVHDLRKCGLTVEQQTSIQVFYEVVI